MWACGSQRLLRLRTVYGDCHQCRCIRFSRVDRALGRVSPRLCAFRLRLHRSAGFVLSLSMEGQAAEARRIRPSGTGTMQKKTWLDAIRTRIHNSSRRRRSSRPVAAQFESMEDRTLLSVTSFFVGGKLVVRSSGADSDSIVVQTNPQSNTLVQVLANGSPIAAVSTLPAAWLPRSKSPAAMGRTH